MRVTFAWIIGFHRYKLQSRLFIFRFVGSLNLSLSLPWILFPLLKWEYSCCQGNFHWFINFNITYPS